jgi:hypothetical protein
MNCNLKVSKLLIVGFLFFFVLCGTSLAEFPFGTPKANLAVSDLVPYELVKKIAIKKAQDMWEQVAIGPALAACDENGDIVAYMFSFSIGTKKFPTPEEIFSEVKYGRGIAKQGLEAMTNADKQRFQNSFEDKSAGEDQSTITQPRLTVGRQTQEISADEKAKKIGRLKMIGSGQYGTVVVSARYDHYPVPLITDYLPPYFYQADLAVNKAKDALSTEQVTLECIYFLYGGHQQFFEFSSNTKKTLIHSYSLEVEPMERILKGKGKQIIPSTEAMTAIA